MTSFNKTNLFLFSLMSLTVKAKTTAEVVNSRPGVGILDNALAAEYKIQNTYKYKNYLNCLTLKNKSAFRPVYCNIGLKSEQT